MGGYAARQRGLPEQAAAQTDTAIEELVPEFVRLYTTGERRSPATDAVAQLISEEIESQRYGGVERVD